MEEPGEEISILDGTCRRRLEAADAAVALGRSFVLQEERVCVSEAQKKKVYRSDQSLRGCWLSPAVCWPWPRPLPARVRRSSAHLEGRGRASRSCALIGYSISPVATSVLLQTIFFLSPGSPDPPDLPVSPGPPDVTSPESLGC